MNMKKDYFMTGELAELCNIGKQTLIHYEDIGLLKPSTRSNNQYRYYSVDTFETIFTIKALQSLGLSLYEIKEYLHSKNPRRFIYLLNEQLTSINDKIFELKKIESSIKDKISFTQQKIELEVVSMGWQEKDTIIVTKYDKSATFPSKLFSKNIMSHIKYCTQKGLQGIFSTGVIFEQTDILQGKYNYSNTFFSKIPKNIDIDTDIDYYMQEGLYLSTYHSGEYAPPPETYAKLLDYVTSHNLSLSGPFYEESILDSNCMDRYENYLYKVSIAVTPN